MLDQRKGVKRLCRYRRWVKKAVVCVCGESWGVERRVAKGVNEPGPERSGGVQLAEVTKQDK